MRCKQKLLQGPRVLGKLFRAVVPILFGTKAPEDSFSMEWDGWGDGFRMIQVQSISHEVMGPDAMIFVF